MNENRWPFALYIQNWFLVIAYALIIINPFFIFVSPGYIALILLFFAYLLFNKFQVQVSYNQFLAICLLVILALYSSFVSNQYYVFQVSLFLGITSTVVLFITTQLVVKSLINSGVSPQFLIDVAIYSVVVNCIVILLQVVFPDLRLFIESLLISGSNRDFTSGFRFRGFSSAGGASLSVAIAIAAAYLTLNELVERRRYLLSMALLFLCFISLIFVGRTGMLMLPLVAVYAIFRSFSTIRFLRYLFFFSIFVLIVGVFWAPFGDAVEEIFGPGLLRYSLGFFLEGASGFEEEGTLAVVASYVTTFPTDIAELLLGTGYYGGDSHAYFTDSGFARLVLAIGFPLALAFYFLFFVFITDGRPSLIFYDRSIFLCFALLCIAEIKEPLLFFGPGSRVVVVMIAVKLMTLNYSKVQALTPSSDHVGKAQLV